MNQSGDLVNVDGKGELSSPHAKVDDRDSGALSMADALEMQEYDPTDRLFGTVYSETSVYVRVVFPTPIEGFDGGLWR